MELDELKELIKLMNETGLTELEVEREDLKIKLKKAIPSGRLLPPENILATEGLRSIDAPMVGTFYRSRSPEDEPFVKEGDLIEPETVVGIIRTLEIDREVKAGLKGKLHSVTLASGQPVEYGQSLFLVEPIE